LGGHSLLVVRLLATIETDFGVEIQARSVFDAANVRQLCAELAKTAIKTNEVPRLSRKYRVV
jgi:acyl carrier protein